MELLTGIFSAFGLSASAGLNAYIPLLTIALLARYTNLVRLASPWDTLTNPWVIGLLRPAPEHRILCRQSPCRQPR